MVDWCRPCHGRAGTSRASVSMPDWRFGAKGLSSSGKLFEQYRSSQFWDSASALRTQQDVIGRSTLKLRPWHACSRLADGAIDRKIILLLRRIVERARHAQHVTE